MQQVDHYRTLQVHPAASQLEIKKAYRQLAIKYHPDKNPGNHFVTDHFKAINEAYAILSDTQKRSRYDEERWLSGMGNRLHEQLVITPAWILKQCEKLRDHMINIDSYRMDHRALHDYIFLMLSDINMSILHENTSKEINSQIINALLISVRRIKATHLDSIVKRLLQLADDDNNTIQEIRNFSKERHQNARINKYLPVMILVLTILLCLAMYIYGKRPMR